MWADPDNDNAACQHRPAEGGSGGIGLAVQGGGDATANAGGRPVNGGDVASHHPPTTPDPAATARPPAHSLIRVVLATVAAQLLVAACGLLIMSGFNLAGAGLAVVTFSVGLAVVAAIAAFRGGRRIRRGGVKAGSAGAAMGLVLVTWLAAAIADNAVAGADPVPGRQLHAGVETASRAAPQPWKRGVGRPTAPGTRSAKMPPAWGCLASVPSLSPSAAEVT